MDPGVRFTQFSEPLRKSSGAVAAKKFLLYLEFDTGTLSLRSLQGLYPARRGVHPTERRREPGQRSDGSLVVTPHFQEEEVPWHSAPALPVPQLLS